MPVLRRRISLPLVVLVALGTNGASGIAQTPSSAGGADDGFLAHWFRRSDQSKAEQPHWLTPLATTTPRLEQEFRYDVNWSQARPGGPYTETYGNTKGLELIPLENVEVIIAVPAYIVHNNPATPNGWGDAQLLVKYRLLAANEEHGNYILTAFVSSTFPSATNGNGQPRAIITPTLSYGMGWGRFDVQGTVGAAEPAGNTSAVGRTYTWNHTFQLHALPKIWPEVEVNQSWFFGGKNDGREQTFVTPGVVIGRMPLTDRVGFTFGAGVQIAVSQFHTTDHAIVFSMRTPF
ncbi:MAG: hypothetical protein ACHQQ3_00615 [Gemmatimonadales bacterium]